MYLIKRILLNDTLSEHSIGNAHETGDISTFNVVNGAIFLFTVFNTHVIDVVHNLVQFGINFRSSPVDVTCILADFKTGSSNTTGINSLTRSKRNTSSLNSSNSARLATHIGNFSNVFYTVLQKFFCIFFAQLILESARTSDVAFYAPSFLTGSEFSFAREFVSHILNFIAVRSTHIKHIVNHFGGNTSFNFANAIRT